MQTRLAKNLPTIVAKLIRGAKKGDVAPLRLLLQIARLEEEAIKTRPKARKRKGLEQIFREQWEREEKLAARLQTDGLGTGTDNGAEGEGR